MQKQYPCGRIFPSGLKHSAIAAWPYVRPVKMQSVNILIQAIQQYQGSALMVSHDRHFIKEVATKIWYIEDHEIKEYPGTYDEYEYWVSQKQQKPSNNQPTKIKVKKKKVVRNTNNELNSFKPQLKRLKTDLEKIEDLIHDLEEQSQNMEAELAKPEVYGNVEKLMKHNQKYDEIKIALDKKQNEWETAALAIDEIEEKLQS